MKILVNKRYVDADSEGFVQTWLLCADQCPLLTFTDASGKVVVAAVDEKGRSRCVEGVAYELKSFQAHRGAVRKDAKVARAPPPKANAMRPPTRYQQFMKLYLSSPRSRGFKVGAEIWMGLPLADRKAVPVDELVNRAVNRA